MHMITGPDPRIFRSMTCKLMLCFCWIGGLLFGLFAAVNAGDSFFLTMRGDVSTMSIPGLLITFLPFLLTAFAVFLPHPGYLVPVVLWEAFSYGFCGYGLSAAYHGAAWLIRCLLMFSQIASVTLLMWLWLRKCDSPDSFSPVTLVACGAAVALIGALDFCLVSPFAVMLI